MDETTGDEAVGVIMESGSGINSPLWRGTVGTMRGSSEEGEDDAPSSGRTSSSGKTSEDSSAGTLSSGSSGPSSSPEAENSSSMSSPGDDEARQRTFPAMPEDSSAAEAYRGVRGPCTLLRRKSPPPVSASKKFDDVPRREVCSDHDEPL